MTRKVLALFAVVCWAAASAPSVAAEKAVETGKRLYAKYCASCHGVDGRGGTELAKLFAKEPPDLTRIAIRHGGWFAEVLVTEIVDGRFAAHGGREMPVWGATLRRDQISLITEYLHSIQESSTAAR
jgi:mono/diheme cytochrome c family protein